MADRHRADGRPPVPSTLKTAMGSVVDGAGVEPAEMIDAAYRLYGRVLRSDGSRSCATDLLAADALLTEAFELQASRDVDQVGRLATAWSESTTMLEALQGENR